MLHIDLKNLEVKFSEFMYALAMELGVIDLLEFIRKHITGRKGK
jgi:hypothetical protein